MKSHPDNLKDEPDNASLVVSQLCEAAVALSKGISGIGIQRILSEPQIQYVVTTLRDGDDSAIANLIVNISGQTNSLYNSTSLYGAQALEAIAHGYALVVIAVRNKRSPIHDAEDQIQAVIGLIDQVQDILLRWVAHGKIIISRTFEEDHALTLIARDFLVTDELRRTGIIPTFSAYAIISTVLQLWQENKK